MLRTLTPTLIFLLMLCFIRLLLILSLSLSPTNCQFQSPTMQKWQVKSGRFGKVSQRGAKKGCYRERVTPTSAWTAPMAEWEAETTGWNGGGSVNSQMESPTYGPVFKKLRPTYTRWVGPIQESSSSPWKWVFPWLSCPSSYSWKSLSRKLVNTPSGQYSQSLSFSNSA